MNKKTERYVYPPEMSNIDGKSFFPLLRVPAWGKRLYGVLV